MASYEQNSTNRQWSVRFRVVEFGAVKQKRLSGYKTKKDAEKGYRDYLDNNAIITNKSNNSDLLFKAIFNKYIEYKKDRLKGSSIFDIESGYTNHIEPFFANMKIFQITKHHILEWQDNLTKQKYSYQHKTKLRGLLSNIFKYAILYYDLPTNPVLQVESFRRTESKKEMPIWSLDEFKKFISCVDDILYKTFFTLLYLTGCRKGEIFALNWQDIDFDNKTISITKNLTRKVKNKTYDITSTKTNTNRAIMIPDTMIELLQKYKLSLEKHPAKTDFVFGGDYPIAENTTTRRFEDYIKKADVPKIHLHCLRHSHASLLIENGENIVAISKRLGHARIEQTLNTYSHLMPNTEFSMVSKLNIKV